MELDGSSRTVAVEHVIDAALHVNNERHLNHHQVELLTEVVLDITLDLKNGLLRLFRREQGVVIFWQNVFQFSVISDTRSGQIAFFILNKRGHGILLGSPTGADLRPQKMAKISIEITAPGLILVCAEGHSDQ